MPTRILIIEDNQNRILIIEDNQNNLDLMTFLLQAFGYTSLSARDGAEGLALAHHEQPDLIICDVQMPTMDGYEVARQLKNDPKLRQVPLIAVTALAMVGDRDKVLAAGFNGYIAKPIAPRTFVKEVETYLNIEPQASPPSPKQTGEIQKQGVHNE
jgi:CheY-like chemotaxis protein